MRNEKSLRQIKNLIFEVYHKENFLSNFNVGGYLAFAEFLRHRKFMI